MNVFIVKVIQTRWGQPPNQVVIARLTITGISIQLNVNAILLLALSELLQPVLIAQK